VNFERNLKMNAKFQTGEWVEIKNPASYDWPENLYSRQVGEIRPLADGSHGYMFSDPSGNYRHVKESDLIAAGAPTSEEIAARWQ
jgi:hypothetical protein